MNKPALNIADATLRHAGAIAADLLPKTWDDFVALSRATTAGHGVTHPLFTRTDEQLADALLETEVLCNPDAKLASMDRFFELYGVRRGDDLRAAGDLAEASRKWDAEHARLSADHRAAYARFGVVAR